MDNNSQIYKRFGNQPNSQETIVLNPNINTELLDYPKGGHAGGELVPPAILQRNGGLSPHVVGVLPYKKSLPDITLDLYSSDLLDDKIILECIKYPDKFHRTIRNLNRCGKFFRIFECSECEHSHKSVYHCGCRFCNHTRDAWSRFGLYLKRFNNFKITSKRLYHFTIGSNLMTKKELEKGISKYMRTMRKKGYKLNYIKVFDIGKRNYALTGLFYNHFHIGLMPEKLDFREFILDSWNILKQIDNRFNFSNKGYQSKSAIFNYFAKREAGIYGHKKEGYFFMPDVIDLNTYLNQYHNKKFKSYSLPEGLIYSNMTSSSTFACPLCQSVMRFRCFEGIIDFMQTKSTLSGGII